MLWKHFVFGGLKIVTHENSVHAYYDYYGNLQAEQKKKDFDVFFIELISKSSARTTR